MGETNLDIDETKLPKNNSKKIWIISISIAILFAIIIGIVFGSSGSSILKEKLEISNISMSVDYNQYLGYSATIKGTAKNVSGKKYSYASVEFSVYDSSGNNLGTALANINNLGSGDTWNFEAVLFDFPKSRPTSYKLVDIIAW